MNRKTMLSLLLLPLVACAADAHDRPAQVATAHTSPQVKRTLTLAGFDTVNLSGCDTISVQRGTKFSVTASGTARDLALLEAETRGKTLVLDRKKGGCKDGYEPLAIAITMPTLRELVLSGATAAKVEPIATAHFEATLSGASELHLGGVDVPHVELYLSGAADLRMIGLHADEVDLSQSGASHARVAGTARVVSIQASGASEADTRDLSTGALTASASGTASIRARATRTAALSASGQSTLGIVGGAACSVEKSGLASITCK